MAETFIKPTQVVWLSMEDVLKIAAKYVETKYHVPAPKVNIIDTAKNKSDQDVSKWGLTVTFTAPLPFNEEDVGKTVTEAVAPRRLDDTL